MQSRTVEVLLDQSIVVEDRISREVKSLDMWKESKRQETAAAALYFVLLD